VVGPQYVSIYNDPYRPVLGNKHPWALGQPVSEYWKEIWHVLRPLIDTLFHGGPATWDEDILLVIDRHGFAEETHCEYGWRCLRVSGSMPFTLVGVLASLTSPVARAGIGVFALSTFDTDYLLVKEADFPQAASALRAAGHLVEQLNA
jgi:hypothetical protein